MKNMEAHRPEIEALLPWHAAGTLSRRDAERVEAALANDAALARQYEMVREELGETIRLNETLGAPSARAMERLMAAIEADGPPARKPRVSFNFVAKIAEYLSQVRPRTLAWAVTAGALAIVLQGGLILELTVDDGEKTRGFRSASYSERAGSGTGSFALIGFAPQASAADLAAFLNTHKATVVDGPSPEGYFKIRVSSTPLSRDDLGEIVKRMHDDNKIVRFVTPSK